METAARRARDARLDLLRVAASFLVVLIHTSAQRWYVLDPQTSLWAGVHLFNAASRCAVPLFFMLSGTLFLGAPEPPSLSRLWKHHIPRLLVIYVLWSVGYGFLNLGPAAFLENPILLVGKAVEGHYHLWFLPAILAVYVLMPVLYAAVHYENGKYVRYLAAVFVGFGVVSATVEAFYDFLPWSLSMIFQKIKPDLCGPCGYVLLGYALSRVRWRRSPAWLLLPYGISVLTVWAGSLVVSRRTGAPFALLCGEYTLPSFVEAASLYLFFRALPEAKGERPRRLLAALAADTLGVYLMHPLLLSLCDRIGLAAPFFSAWPLVLPLAVVIFALSAAVTAALRRIPAVGKWIV